MTEIVADLVWGARINIYFAVIALPLGFALAILLALGMTRSKDILYFVSSAYVYFFRGSPLFIQLYFFYFLFRASGLHTYELGVEGRQVFEFVLNALFLAPFVLLLNTAGYSAVIFANALKAVPRGDLEAADAFGFSPFQKFWRITWPSMLRIAWPAYTNEAAFLFLSTTLVYASLPLIKKPGGGDYRDVFRVAVDVAHLTFNPFVSFVPAMILFVVMSLGIFFVFGLVNDQLNRHLNQNGRKSRLRFRPHLIR